MKYLLYTACAAACMVVLPAYAQTQTPEKQAEQPLVTDAAALKAQLDELEYKYDQMSEQFERVMQVVRDDKLGLYRELAAAHMTNHAYEQAAKALETIVFIAPDDLQAHYQLGLIYARYIKDTPKALRHLKRCIALNKDEKIKKDALYLVGMIED